MTIPLKPAAVLGLLTAGLLALGTAAPTSAGYVDEEAATATATTAASGAYLPSDLNRSPLTVAALSGGVVYLWGAKGGGLAADGKWNSAADGASTRDVVRVDLPVTADPATTAPVRVKEVALLGYPYATAIGTGEYSAGATGAVLTESGEVYTWGTNSGGKLGTGNADTSAVCNRGRESSCSNGPLLTGIRKLTASSNAFYALTDRGDLYGWGTAQFASSGTSQTYTGEFGMDGTGAPIRTFTSPKLLKTGLADVWGVAHGRFDLTASNELSFSGFGSPSMTSNTGATGQPAFGTPTVDRAMPTLPAAVASDRIVDIQAVPNAGIALTASGGLYSWGSGTYYLGRGVTSGGYYAPAKIVLGPVKDFSLNTSVVNAVLADGSVVGWGVAFASEGNTDPNYAGSWVSTPRSLNNVFNKNNPTPTGNDNIAVATLAGTAYLTKADYTLYGWGNAGGVNNLLLPGAKHAWSGATGVQLYIAPISRLTMPGVE